MDDRSLFESNVFVEALGYKEYPYRMLLLFLYFSLLAVSQLSLVAYSAAFPLLSGSYDDYRFSKGELLLFSFLCPLTWALGTFPAMHLIRKMDNNAKIIRLASNVLILGSICKIFSDVNISLIIIGQILCSFGLSLVAKSNAKISVSWWAINKSEAVIQVQDTAIPIGLSLGFIIPGTFVLNQWDPKVYFLVESLLTIAFALIAFVLFKDKPRLPPSKFSNYQIPDIIPNLRAYLSSRNFVLLLFAYSLTYGTSISLKIYFPFIAANFGFEIGSIEVFLGIAMIFGLIISFLLAMLKGKYKNPHFWSLIQIIALIGATWMISVGLNGKDAYKLYGGIFICCCFFISLPGFFIGLISEIEPDLHEGLASGSFTVGGSLVCLISGLILMEVKEGSITYTFYAMTSVPIALLICLFLLMFIKK